MKKLGVILFLMLAFCGYAQVDRSIRPPAGPAPETKIGEAASFVLANGLKVFVVENHKLPTVVFNLIVDYDPVVETDHAGCVEIAGMLLGSGTKTKTKAQIDQAVDFIGARFSTSPNGIYASALRKHSDELLSIFSDVLLNAEFRQEEFDKFIQKAKSGLLASKEEPNFISDVVSRRIIYGDGHPYAESMTLSTIEKVTLQQCNDFFASYFKPNISYLSIVGDITVAEAKLWAEKYFGAWKQGNEPVQTYPLPSAPLVTKVHIVDRPNAVQSVISIGNVVDLPKNSPDVIAANIANTVLGGGVFRLFVNLREKHGFTYGAYSDLTSDPIAGSFMASTSVRNSVTDSAVTEILYEMKRLQNELVPADELTKVKNYLNGNFALSLESPQTIANFAVNIDRYKLPQDYYTTYMKRVQAVTSEEVQKAARKYILPENTHIIIVGKSADISEPLKKFSLSKIVYYDTDGNKIDPNAMKTPEGLTGEKVIETYLEKLGGKEKYFAVQDKKTTMTAQIQGLNVVVTVSNKAPNKFVQALSIGAMEQKTVFDGVQGFSKSPQGTVPLEGDMLEFIKSEADLHLLGKLKEYNIKAELSGVQKLNGADVYKVALIPASGKQHFSYFDTVTGLKVRDEFQVDTPNGTVDIISDYSDFREVNGLLYPFMIIQTMGGMPMPFTFTVTSVEVNTGLSDELFK